ncbi:ATP-grasp domain-containing protein [Brevundimonas sp. BR2-1]|uniref:ATP-grasp domain-containing protein n=1 Tax=Brevundimonas sp. BR2-1 TaxID=3031123 RepID=UPI0030A7A944
MSNVLILAAGRRVELVEAFKEGLAARIPGARVFATDTQPLLSSACHVADQAFRSIPVVDDGYIKFLLNLCIEHGVKLVVPTLDTELSLLARNRAMFALNGIDVVISDIELVDICRDKRRTAELFDKVGIDTPTIYARDAIRFPAFAKPYDGSRSIGAAPLPSPADLTPAMLADEKLMFMEMIGADHVEYTVDAYYDRQGELRCLVPRQRLEVRSGEVSKGVTRRGPVYDYLRPRLGRLPGARGCITVQLFVHHEAGRFAGIEINPRFGGGYPLTHAAGAAYATWLIDEYFLGQAVPFSDEWESNLLMLRYDAKVLARDVEI